MPVTKPTKAIIAAIGVLVTALSGAVADDVLTMSEVANIVVAFVPGVLTVVAVWRVPNKPKDVENG